MPGRMLDRVFVAGIPVIRARAGRVARHICESAAAGEGRVYVFVNAHSASLRRDTPGYGAVLADKERTVALAAGASITGTARLLGHGRIGKTAGKDLLGVTSSLCAEQGVPIFLLGGHPGVAATMARRLVRDNPGLEVVGAVSPPFGPWSDGDSDALVAQVRASGAGVLWLGVCAPQQEVWAYQHAAELGIPVVCAGCVFQSRHSAAHRRREWVWRIRRAPERVWRHGVVAQLAFAGDVLRYGYRLAFA